MEEEQPEVEQRPRYGLAVDVHVLLIEVPAARARNQHRGPVLQAVSLAALLEADGAPHCVAQVDLPIHHVVPGRAVCILEVRHEGGGARIQRIDHHLAVGGAGELDAAVEQVLRLRRYTPLLLSYFPGVWKKIRQRAAVEFFLPRSAAREQVLAPRLEMPMQIRYEIERFPGEDLGEPGADATKDTDVPRARNNSLHRSILRDEMRHCKMKSRGVWE